MSCGRFKRVTEEDISNFTKDNENKNTAKKTKLHYKLLKEYLIHEGVQKEAQELKPRRLNNILRGFFFCLKKPNGDEYEPTTIRCISNSIQRHLSSHNYPHQISNSPLFSKCRQTLSAKYKVMKICYLLK